MNSSHARDLINIVIELLNPIGDNLMDRREQSFVSVSLMTSFLSATFEVTVEYS